MPEGHSFFTRPAKRADRISQIICDYKSLTRHMLWKTSRSNGGCLVPLSALGRFKPRNLGLKWIVLHDLRKNHITIWTERNSFFWQNNNQSSVPVVFPKTDRTPKHPKKINACKSHTCFQQIPDKCYSQQNKGPILQILDVQGIFQNSCHLFLQ